MVRFILILVLGAGIIGAVILTPLLAVPILGLVGFSAIGPVAGTLAAWIQSCIGSVAAGSYFAGAQATAMGAGVPAIAQIISVGFNPLTAGVGAGIVGAVILTPLLAVPILNAVGFSSIGPVGGTLAAGIQSGIGNVAAGSYFAGAQATAMGAGVPVIAQAIGGTVTGIVGLTAAAIRRRRG